MLKRLARQLRIGGSEGTTGSGLSLLPATGRKRAKEPPVFPRLERVADCLRGLGHTPHEPTRSSSKNRLRLLEAKVEYLLDENYRLRSLLRRLPETIHLLNEVRGYQVESFDYQWGDIVYHDDFLSNPTWRDRATQDVARRAGVTEDWFAGKKVLDCGCGPGRHTWAFARLGARVTAFDLAERALKMAREAVAEFDSVTIEARSVLSPLPYPTDFDLVWCYGVLHHTGDTVGGLKNIAKHVRPGGRIYLMLYAEPRRNNTFDYQYQHEVTTLREATRMMTFNDKAKIFERIDGPTQTLSWFDAISSEINDLYTFEEIGTHLAALGFEAIIRTMPEENMHNVAAIKRA